MSITPDPVPTSPPGPEPDPMTPGVTPDTPPVAPDPTTPTPPDAPEENDEEPDLQTSP